MNNIIVHKNYLGSVEYSDDDEIFFGKILGIRDLISYEGTSVKELKSSFMEAVDDYLETCNSLNRKPEKPFKGSFNIRIDSDLHRMAFVLATQKNESLNNFVKEAIIEKIKNWNSKSCLTNRQ